MSEFEPVGEHALEGNKEVSESIFDTPETRVVMPEKPLVPPQEGTHLRVLPTVEQKPYFDPNSSIRESLPVFVEAVAAARAVFGSTEDEDNYYWSQWVNVHLVPRFGGREHLQIEVVGRNARGDTWAQPIDYPKEELYPSFPTVQQEREMLARELPKQTTAVNAEIASQTLFNQDNYQGKPGEKTIFAFQNYEVMMARENPHVEEGGLHLWVHANTPEHHEGVQSNLHHGVEQFIVASSVAKSIYSELGVPIEIHFSGNWGLPTAGHWKENLSAHANLYGAPPGQERVALPPRPGYERPTIPEATREQVAQALQTNMQKYLQEFIGMSLADMA